MLRVDHKILNRDNKSMTTESFLHFVFSNNAALIETLVAAILLTAAYLTYRTYKMSKDLEPGGTSASTGQLESMLKKVLEQSGRAPAAIMPASGEAEGPSAAEVAVLAEQNSKLKNELNKRLLELEQIRTNVANSSHETMPADVRAALETQIQELQKKLEEFDIISQDIADLSFYKEENQRLQSEIDALKKGAPAKGLNEAPPADVKSTELKQTGPKQTEPKGPSPLKPVPDQKAAEPAPEPTAKADAPPPAEAPAVTAVQEVGDEDLIKEYAAMVDAHRSAILPSADSTTAAKMAAAKEIGEPATEVDLGTMDLDKMVAEAGTLDENAAAPTVDVLNENTDPDKIAAEATSMVDPQTKAVMGEFEKFATKETKAKPS
jgi:hypothetical protein